MTIIAKAAAQSGWPSGAPGGYLEALIKRIYTSTARAVEHVGALIKTNGRCCTPSGALGIPFPLL